MANYIVNSSASSVTYNARCFNISDDSDWLPSEAEYPKDGTIDLSGGKGLDTQYTPKVGDGIYWLQEIVKDVSYNIYALHIKENDVVDVYVGNENTPIILTESDKAYILPTESWKILEAIPDIVESSPTELFPNGTFDTNIDGVTTGGVVGQTGPATIVHEPSYGDGSLRVTRGAVADDRDAWIILENLEIGKTYDIHIEQLYTSDNWNTCRFDVPVGTALHVFSGLGSDDVFPDFAWEATETTAHIRFRTQSNTGNSFVLDNVSVTGRN